MRKVLFLAVSAALLAVALPDKPDVNNDEIALDHQVPEGAWAEPTPIGFYVDETPRVGIDPIGSTIVLEQNPTVAPEVAAEVDSIDWCIVVPVARIERINFLPFPKERDVDASTVTSLASRRLKDFKIASSGLDAFTPLRA